VGALAEPPAAAPAGVRMLGDVLRRSPRRGAGDGDALPLCGGGCERWAAGWGSRGVTLPRGRGSTGREKPGGREGCATSLPPVAARSVAEQAPGGGV